MDVVITSSVFTKHFFFQKSSRRRRWNLLKWVGNSVKNGSVWLATDTSHLAKIRETMMPLKNAAPLQSAQGIAPWEFKREEPRLDPNDWGFKDEWKKKIHSNIPIQLDHWARGRPARQFKACPPSGGVEVIQPEIYNYIYIYIYFSSFPLHIHLKNMV